MAAGRKARPWLIASLSLALHVLVLAWLARPATLEVSDGPPAMTVELIEPIVRPARIRTADGPQALAKTFDVSRSSTPVPTVEAQPGPVETAPATIGPAAAPDAVRAALRASFGCARPSSLTRQEREACVERLGRMAPGATAYVAPMDPAKRAYFDEVAAVGPTGGVSTDEKPGALTPDHPYARVVKCSVPFGPGRKKNDYQGAIRLGRTPCSITLQGSFFTPEAMVRKR